MSLHRLSHQAQKSANQSDLQVSSQKRGYKSGASFAGGKGGSCPLPSKETNMQCKTTHTRRYILARRLPCHCDVQTVQFVCLHFGVEILMEMCRKITKIVATRCQILRLKCATTFVNTRVTCYIINENVESDTRSLSVTSIWADTNSNWCTV